MAGRWLAGADRVRGSFDKRLLHDAEPKIGDGLQATVEHDLLAAIARRC